MTSEVVAYVPADSGVMLCPDCAAEHAEDNHASLDDGDAYGAAFEDSESDSPSACDECGAFIHESLTDDGVTYVADALRDYIAAELFTRPDGSPRYGGTASVLDEWRDAYGDVIRYNVTDEHGATVGDRLLDAYDAVRDRQRERIAVVLVTMDGIARNYGEDANGVAWTESEREDGETDDCDVCGDAISSGWLCLDDGSVVVCGRHVFTPHAARTIAGDWHDGQASPLYALASSGTVTSEAAYAVTLELGALDVSRAARARVNARPGYPLGRDPFPLDERRRLRRELRALRDYCQGVRERVYPAALLDIRAAMVDGRDALTPLVTLGRIWRALDAAGLDRPSS